MLKKLTTVSLLVFSLLATQVMAFAGEMLGQTDFDDGVGLPWHTCESATGKLEFDISGGTYNITVNNKGVDKWDVQFRHRGISIESGKKYTVKFTVKADKATKLYAKVGDQKEPYAEYWNNNWNNFSLSANTPLTVNETFTASGSQEVAEFAFHLGGELVSNTPVTYTFDDISLDCAGFDPTPIPATPTPKPIRLNQLGFFPDAAKKATFVSSSSGQTWDLMNSSGTSVANGKTTSFGADKDSGDTVQIIDFSSYKTPGKGYYLKVGTGTSFSFDIGTDMYKDLMQSSFTYFYNARSGVPIVMPYCVEEQWARPAGHVSDVLACEKQTEAVLGMGWDPYSSSHTLDVSGGWYDAGDHGKYVLNGGISVWTLQNQYERALKTGAEAQYADNELNIPESGNGYPDILDETRIHMDVMVRMQVPAGNPRAGMAHHKGHDVAWTGLAVRPDEDTNDRHLKPPTTAATLNLAATGAQAYRLWKDLDSSFANKCLNSAEIAWDAAIENPAIFAPMNDAIGGGPYGDDYVEDDFYWAGCELYAATGDAKYLNYIKSSKWYLKLPYKLENGEESNTTASFNWGNTHSLGTITLALLAPEGISSSDIQTAKDNIVAASNAFIDMEDGQGYGIPLQQCTVVGDDGIAGYPWGSNSFVMNNSIVMAYAYDFSKDIKHFNGAVSGMDYLMGRNPMDVVYVTGYGDKPVANPHHRFYAYQVDPNYPKAPPGIAVGGPNSGLQDPWVKGSGWQPGEMPPQKCYMDHIESWSTNECTTNWNAPMTWLTGYFNEVGGKLEGGSTTSPTGSIGSAGDCNGDGKVNSTDYALLRRHILTITSLTGTGLANADVNKDGRVNSTDYAGLRRIILGLV